MNQPIPEYEVEEISLEQAVLMLATEEEKTKTDYSKTSAMVLEYMAA
ncbi:hypothetical protein MNBD_GAMMA21-913 [hydrothermal vent metagenome]|uniref:Uncharacterized protein n=1 Tax=hydrothermal vent metagenome TaxID=652676 RepID=A0A3B1AG68_9ZZZZ